MLSQAQQLDSTTQVDDRFPMKLLALCVGLTLALPALGVWNVWMTYSGFVNLASNEIRLMRLNGEILHLDEVLTMSARMAAATGDLRWETRYDEYDPVLVQKIEETIAIAPEVYGEGAAGDTNKANAKLIDMERRAFERVREKDLSGANEILLSDEYAQQKAIYAEGMKRSRQAANRHIDNLLATFQTRAAVSLGIGLAVLILLGACWLHIVKLIVRHLHARSLAEADLHRANATLEERVQERTAALADTNHLLQDSLDDLQRTQRDLVMASRKAGMADVASAVLHNVGNALNSVNISSNMVLDLVRRSKVGGFAKAGELIKAHSENLAGFMTNDEKGKHLPGYLCTLAGHVCEEHATILKEVESLQKNVDHIKVIVSRQQKHAIDAKPVLEAIRPEEIADEAIALVRGSCEQQNIVFERDYASVAAVVIDRHRALQIIVNLLNNARHALAEVSGNRRIKVKVRAPDAARFAIEVEDNGCGIAPEHVAKLFQHGFTTKGDGHGLGLHSSACLAKELGGSLLGQSPGAGRGAHFTLVLPLRQEAA